MTRALEDQIDPAGKRILDVGCGAGGLVTRFRARGGRALGVDPFADGARAAGAFAKAAAERLPIADGALDVVVFAQSLHHAPRARLDDALIEARRAARKGGLLLVAEPMALGPGYETFAPVVDERADYARAQAALDRALARGGWRERAVDRFVVADDYADVEALFDALLAVDPGRADAVARGGSELRARFAASSEPVAGGRRLLQPMLLRAFEAVPGAVWARPVLSERELAAARALRVAVYVEEQGFSGAAEFDAFDAPGAARTIGAFTDALDGPALIGNLRWRRVEEGAAIQRVAVDRSRRGRGAATALTRAAIDDIAAIAGSETPILLAAQAPVVELYRRQGFVVRGEPFDDEGVRHLEMRRADARR